MNPFIFIDCALTPGLSLLSPTMNSPAARAMVMAICLQESELQHRRQIGGPARGYAQFEPVGCLGVLTHPRSRIDAAHVCRDLDVPPQAETICTVMEWCDPLTVAFARLLLWTSPRPLPADEHRYEDGWKEYLRLWRPGKPHPETWAGCYGVSWDLVSR